MLDRPVGYRTAPPLCQRASGDMLVFVARPLTRAGLLMYAIAMMTKRSRNSSWGCRHGFTFALSPRAQGSPHALARPPSP